MRVDYKQDLLNVDDIRVTNTSKGLMLRIKKGVQWFNALLYGNEIQNPNIFIPKVWIYSGVTASATSGTLQLPSFLNAENIISVSYMHNFSSDKLHFWAWDTDEGAASNSVNEIDLAYDKSENSILWELGSASSEQVQGKEYRIAVFFK